MQDSSIFKLRENAWVDDKFSWDEWKCMKISEISELGECTWKLVVLGLMQQFQYVRLSEYMRLRGLPCVKCVNRRVDKVCVPFQAYSVTVDYSVLIFTLKWNETSCEISPAFHKELWLLKYPQISWSFQTAERRNIADRCRCSQIRETDLQEPTTYSKQITIVLERYIQRKVPKAHLELKGWKYGPRTQACVSFEPTHSRWEHTAPWSFRYFHIGEPDS